MTRRVPFAVSALALVALLGAGLPSAATPGASVVIRDALHRVSDLGRAELSRSERLDALHSVARDLIDTRAMGLQAIGTGIDGRSEAQRDEFLRLFDELILRSYLQKLLLFHDPTFRFARETQRGDLTVVYTEVVTAKDSYAVTYEMQERDGRWLARNILVEGINLTQNYSAQFAAVLRDRSFDDLLALMRRKVDGFRARDLD